MGKQIKPTLNILSSLYPFSEEAFSVLVDIFDSDMDAIE